MCDAFDEVAPVSGAASREDTEDVVEAGIAGSVEQYDPDETNGILDFLIDAFTPRGPGRHEYSHGATGALAFEYAPPLPQGEDPTISFEIFEGEAGAVTLVDFNIKGLEAAAEASAQIVAPQAGVPFTEDNLRALANIATRAADALAEASGNKSGELVAAGDRTED